MELIKRVTNLLLLVVIVFGFLSCNEDNKEESKPNIVYIFADKYRRASLGFLNEDPVKTPNLDALAKNGVFFSRAVANHPLCSPYRAMLMTGQYPLSNGVISNCHSGRTIYTNFLKKDTECFSDVLANNGYSAGYVGKWHLDGPEPTPEGVRANWDCWCPPDRRHGFTFWYAYGTHGRHFNPYYWSTNAKEDEKTVVDQWSPAHEAKVIMKFIDNKNNERDNNKPFALFWGINPPHTPFSQVPEEFKSAFEGKVDKDVLNRPNVECKSNKDMPAGDKGVEKKIHLAPDYFAQVNGVDKQIGRVIAYLKKNRLYDNTIIVFSADHGEMLGSHGLMHKNIWFKEAWEIPLIVHYPKAVQARTEDLMISVPDYMPTLLGLAGLAKHIPASVEGKDYSDVFFNKLKSRPDKQLYFGSSPDKPSEGRRGFRDDEYTYAEVKLENGEKSFYLYHDKNDPFQMKNIWGEDINRDQLMAKALNNMLVEMNDPWIQK